MKNTKFVGVWLGRWFVIRFRNRVRAHVESLAWTLQFGNDDSTELVEQYDWWKDFLQKLDKAIKE